ncbi:MAG: Ig-like domain-containing protein [Bacilli bacterium]|nr:Ig-like domain-containing protein [Bacilli bacterium]
MKKISHSLKILFLITSGLLLTNCNSNSDAQITITPSNIEEKEPEANYEEKEPTNNNEEKTTPIDSNETNTSNKEEVNSEENTTPIESNNSNTETNNGENENVENNTNNTGEGTNTEKPGENTNQGNAGENTPVQDLYEISQTSAVLTMGEELQLSITNNGKKVNNVTWTSSDADLVRVDKDGVVRACFFTNENEKVTITGKVGNKASLKCDLRINPRNDSIFKKVYNRSQVVNQDDEGHVIYSFVHAGLEANATINVTKTFQYDSFTGICCIKVIKSFVQGNVTAYYVGRNDFYWGDYENGIFYGQYSEVYNEQQKDAVFSFKNVGIDYLDHTIYVSSNTTYSIVRKDWNTITDEDMIVKGVFYRIEECVEYAEEKFSEYNFGVHLF